MKKLNPGKNNSELSEIEPAYPTDYEGVYTDGYYGAASNQGDERQLLSGFFSTLRKHWFLILAINLLITAATVVYVAQKPDYYQAEVRIQVNAENNPAAGATGKGGGAVIVNNPGNDPGYFTTQLQILEGGGLLRRVAQTLDLEHNPNFLDPQNGKRLTAWQNVQRMFGFYRPPAPEQTVIAEKLKDNKLNLNRENSLDPNAETEKYAGLVSRIKGSLSVLPVKDSRTSFRETRLIEIEYTHGDPVLAAKVVNAIGDAYVLQNLEQKIQTNASAGDFLQKRVADLQSEIRLGEERLINYSKDNQIVSLDAGQNTVVQRFGDLNMKLGEAENNRISAQTAYQAALQNQMRAATAETRDPQVVGLESKLAELRQRLAQLKTEYTDEWYEVVQTKKQIEGTENQLSSLRKRASDIQIAGLEERLNEAVARERELRGNFDKQRADVMKQNEASINYRIIQQEINTNKTLLDGLLQRSRENDVILNGMPNNVLVAERAAVPNAAAGPERMRNVMLAFIVSLLAGCGLAFLLDWLNDSVHNSDDIETALGLPLLAAIPSAPVGLGKRLLPKNLSLTRKKQGKKFYDLDIFERPEFVESYLQLRTCLMLSTAGGAPKRILVTSGEEGEGKTVTALNLAESLAKSGGKILLIDADLRYPRLHLIKEINNDLGLTTLLTTGDINEQLIEGSIQKNGLSNLHILTAGEKTVNPANLLCSEEMRDLLANLSAKYTHIVIDSPPVLYFADSTILSTLVDSVIIVVRDNVSSKQLVLKAKKTLQNVGANVVGMVMNGVHLQRSGYNRYKYYDSEAELPTDNGYQTLKLN
jgi:polysaccharide biosynthesis transport protein